MITHFKFVQWERSRSLNIWIISRCFSEPLVFLYLPLDPYFYNEINLMFKVWTTLKLNFSNPYILATWAGNFRMGTFHPDCLIRISNVDTFNFLLNPLFVRYSREKPKIGFSKLESPSRFCILILNGAKNFKFPGF